MTRLVELAEALQAPVIDQHGRMNFPSSHPLNQSEGSGPLIANADVILGLELTDFWGTVSAFRDSLHRSSRSRIKPGTRLISITATDLFSKSNFQDFQRYPEVDVAMAADAEATLPALTEAVRKLVTDDRRRAFQERRTRFEQAHARERDAARTEAAVAWDATPISTARMAAEIWAQIQNEDWSLVVGERQQQRLGVPAVGLRASTTSTWATRAAPASATARRRPSAARSPTRSTAGCR